MRNGTVHQSENPVQYQKLVLSSRTKGQQERPRDDAESYARTDRISPPCVDVDSPASCASSKGDQGKGRRAGIAWYMVFPTLRNSGAESTELR